MKRIDLIQRARRNLSQSKVRTVLTALAIAVGATTITLALAAGNGARDYIYSIVGDKISAAGELTITGSYDANTGELAKITEDLKAQIDTINSIEKIECHKNDDTNKNCQFITAVVKEGQNIDAAKAEVQAISSKISISSGKDRYEQEIQVVNVAQWGLIGFGVLAILASVFGIINTQYISVLERTREIGLMKALGMRRKDIGRMFRYEAAWIGFLGGFIGVITAWLITLLNPVINSALHLKDGTRLLIIDPMQAIILILSLMLVAVASGLIPASKAAKLDPVEALRTE